MKKVCIANWKMNGNLEHSTDFLISLGNKLTVKSLIDVLDIILCPPACYLHHFMGIIEKYSLPVFLGGQNCHWKDFGPFTSSISPKMLADLGCKYVILGHLENRDKDFRTIFERVDASIDSSLKVILCVSENDIINEDFLQLIVSKNYLSDKIIIAYEPSLSIGTGNLPDFSQLALDIKKIRDCFDFRVVYGGSVNDLNSKDLVSNSILDGLLVGNASLDVDKFYRIILSLL